MGVEHKADLEEVRNFRYLCKNCFSVLWRFENNGNARATGVRVQMELPSNLLVILRSELDNIVNEQKNTLVDDAYEGWNARFFEPDESGCDCKKCFLSKDELSSTAAIAELLDPADFVDGESEGYEIFQSYVMYRNKEIQHLSKAWFRGICLVPTAPGRYEIKCKLLRNEYAEPVEQIIVVEVE